MTGGPAFHPLKAPAVHWMGKEKSMSLTTMVSISVYIISMLIFLCFLFVVWIKNRKAMRGYMIYGLIFGMAWLLMDSMFYFVIHPKTTGFVSVISVVIADGFLFSCLMMVTVVGMYSCDRIEYDVFALLKPGGTRRKKVDPCVHGDDLSAAEGSLSEGIDAGAERPALSSTPEPGRERVQAFERNGPSWNIDKQRMKKSLFAVLVIVACAITYSIVLYQLIPARLSKIVKGLVEIKGSNNIHLGKAIILLLVVKYAFMEEVVFRLGMQNLLSWKFRLEGKRYWIGIFVATLIWTFGHAGMVDPDWAKFLQIFPFGLALGWLFKRQGLESCILAHALFNVCMVFIPVVSVN